MDTRCRTLVEHSSEIPDCSLLHFIIASLYSGIPIYSWIAGLCASVQTRMVTRLRPVVVALLPSNGASFIGVVSVSRHYQCLVSRDLHRTTSITFCSPYLRKRARVFQRADEDVQR